MPLINRVIYAHYLLNDAEFFNQKEFSALREGWDIKEKLATVSYFSSLQYTSHQSLQSLSGGLAYDIFSTLYRPTSLSPAAVLERLDVGFIASPARATAFWAAAGAFYFHIKQWIYGSGHPTSCEQFVAACPPASVEESVIEADQLRAYYLLKGLTDNRFIPAEPNFRIEVRLITRLHDSSAYTP